MADLIDRQKIKARFEPWLKVKGYSEGELNIIRAVLYEITVMPSADAVEVVRCKDCKLIDTEECNMRRGFYSIKDDDFCSYGERKTEWQI